MNYAFLVGIAKRIPNSEKVVLLNNFDDLIKTSSGAQKRFFREFKFDVLDTPFIERRGVPSAVACVLDLMADPDYTLDETLADVKENNQYLSADEWSEVIKQVESSLKS